MNLLFTGNKQKCRRINNRGRKRKEKNRKKESKEKGTCSMRQKVRITLRLDNATYKHVAVKFTKICKVNHLICLSNFAEKERKEKIRETERKDKGNNERVMMF